MIIFLPLSVQVSSRKNFRINLNEYRNAHFRTLNSAKIEFKRAVQDQINKIKGHFSNIKLTYKVFKNDKRSCDVANICSVADKFFCDALVESGKIKDDSYKYIKEIIYSWGGVDTENPRIEVVIEEVK